LRTVSYFVFTPFFRELQKRIVKTKYIPIVHDFAVLKKGFLFIDSPFVWNFFKRIPVVFCKQKPTYIHVNEEIYSYPTGFYLFHYANVIEYNDTIEIYGSVYDSIDFSSLNLEGKYRKIIINKRTRKVILQQNSELEDMNLDFPVQWEKYILLRSIKDKKTIDGFVLCNGLAIVGNLKLKEDRHFCGEPAIIEIENIPYLIGFSYDSFNNGYFTMIHLFDPTNYIEIPFRYNLTIGFHSIYREHSAQGF
jgi:hypothetical protein